MTELNHRLSFFFDHAEFEPQLAEYEQLDQELVCFRCTPFFCFGLDFRSSDVSLGGRGQDELEERLTAMYSDDPTSTCCHHTV